MGRGASADAGFRACGHDQRTEPVWRLCARPLETFARSLFTLYGNPTLAGRGGSVSRRDHNLLAGNRAQPSGGTKLEESTPAKRQPLFGREREEGKDSHSRQWRLSMAVFLNRNKRPLAAPIEVAELLSEKPPPSHTPSFVSPLRKGARGRGFSLEKPPPPEFQSSLTPDTAFWRSCRGSFRRHSRGRRTASRT